MVGPILHTGDVGQTMLEFGISRDCAVVSTVAVSESGNIAIGCLTLDAYTYIYSHIHSHTGAVTESGDIATGYLTSDAYIHIH